MTIPDDAAEEGRPYARHVIAFGERGMAVVRAELLADAPLETARFLFARSVRTPAATWRLVVYDELKLAAEDYTRRTEVEIELPPGVVARAMQRARADGASIILTHSHPRGRTVGPSPYDLRGEGLLLPAFRRRIPDVPHARLIVGPRAVQGALFDVDGTEQAVDFVEVGTDLVAWSGSGRPDAASRIWDNRYDRQVRAFGSHGQRHLAGLRVAIIGIGGTGSAVVQQLALLGVRGFLLIDPDVVEETNLNRVIGACPGDVGRPKVDVARDLILRINPDAAVERLQADVRDRPNARRLLDTDIFMCCTDSQGSRAIITQVAYQYLLPGIDLGVVIQANETAVSHIAGRVQMLAPGLPCLLCCDVLDPEVVRRDLLTDEMRAADPYIVGATVPQPAVVSINSTASSLAVTMLLSAITGIPYATRNQRLRLESGIVSRVEGRPRANCPVCSYGGALMRGDSWPMPGRAG